VSQRLVEDRVDVLAQTVGVDPRKVPEAVDERSCAKRASRQRPKLGNRLPIAGDGHALAQLDPADHLGTVVPQVSDRCLTHNLTVSPVIQRKFEPHDLRAVPLRHQSGTLPAVAKRLGWVATVVFLVINGVPVVHAPNQLSGC
jgi:hypothetical protein